ncbi:MAG: SDR family oxidoreductase [Pseudomonadota bacterium]
MTKLAIRRAVVTGGGSGVGAVIAQKLAEAGVQVVITGRRMEPLQETARLHASILPLQADVRDENSVAAMFAAAQKLLGGIDLVIANAGMAQSAPVAKIGLDLWQDTLSVNLTGAFLTFREGLTVMDRTAPGRLIAIASTAGLKGYPYVAAYCAAKHGVVGLVRAMAVELAKTSVTVNAICPGFTETPMLEQSIENIVAKTGMSHDAARASLSAANPQGRFIQPAEIADAVMWLCAENAGSVTGQAISVSGGEI